MVGKTVKQGQGAVILFILNFQPFHKLQAPVLNRNETLSNSTYWVIQEVRTDATKDLVKRKDVIYPFSRQPHDNVMVSHVVINNSVNSLAIN